MRTVSEIMKELRSHPDCMAAILWLPGDAEGEGIDPASVNWGTVEDRGIEIGWDVIQQTGQAVEKE